MNDTVENPKHLRGQDPCSWCGARWTTDWQDGGQTMQHTKDCGYIKALDFGDNNDEEN